MGGLGPTETLLAPRGNAHLHERMVGGDHSLTSLGPTATLSGLGPLRRPGLEPAGSLSRGPSPSAPIRGEHLLSAGGSFSRGPSPSAPQRGRHQHHDGGEHSLTSLGPTASLSRGPSPAPLPRSGAAEHSLTSLGPTTSLSRGPSPSPTAGQRRERLGTSGLGGPKFFDSGPSRETSPAPRPQQRPQPASAEWSLEDGPRPSLRGAALADTGDPPAPRHGSVSRRPSFESLASEASFVPTPTAGKPEKKEKKHKKHKKQDKEKSQYLAAPDEADAGLLSRHQRSIALDHHFDTSTSTEFDMNFGEQPKEKRSKKSKKHAKEESRSQSEEPHPRANHVVPNGAAVDGGQRRALGELKGPGVQRGGSPSPGPEDRRSRGDGAVGLRGRSSRHNRSLAPDPLEASTSAELDGSLGGHHKEKHAKKSKKHAKENSLDKEGRRGHSRERPPAETNQCSTSPDGLEPEEPRRSGRAGKHQAREKDDGMIFPPGAVNKYRDVSNGSTDRHRKERSRPPSPLDGSRSDGIEDANRSDVVRFLLCFTPPGLAVQWAQRPRMSPARGIGGGQRRPVMRSTHISLESTDLADETVRQSLAERLIRDPDKPFLHPQHRLQLEALFKRLAAGTLPTYRIIAPGGANVFRVAESGQQPIFHLPRGALALARERCRRPTGWWIRLPGDPLRGGGWVLEVEHPDKGLASGGRRVAVLCEPTASEVRSWLREARELRAPVATTVAVPTSGKRGSDADGAGASPVLVHGVAVQESRTQAA